MIIDRTKPEFSDVPEGLEGEVLLERVRDRNGRLVGYLTVDVDTVRGLKNRTPEEIERMGLFKYMEIIGGMEGDGRKGA